MAHWKDGNVGRLPVSIKETELGTDEIKVGTRIGDARVVAVIPTPHGIMCWVSQFLSISSINYGILADEWGVFEKEMLWEEGPGNYDGPEQYAKRYNLVTS